MLKKAEKEVVVIAQFMVKEGKVDEFLGAVRSLLELTPKEEGCLRYELNQATDNPRSLTFIEKYQSQEAFDFHRNAPYLKAFFTEAAPPLMESVTVTVCQEILP